MNVELGGEVLSVEDWAEIRRLQSRRRWGFFSGFVALRASEAWELFGEANGTASLAEMRLRVGRYRSEPIRPGEDPMIGCVFVRDTRFFPADEAADPPPGFA